MKKILYTIVLACLLLIIAGIYPPPSQAGDDACVRKAFLTQQYEDACRAGGQAEAKKVAKRFLSQAKRKGQGIVTCKSCHTSLKPYYQLKTGALDKFRSAGGR